MAEPQTSKETAVETAASARRSTRVFQAVPLSISGQNRTGNLFLESTSAVAINCHGCLYPSRYEYRHGSWVTIEVPNQYANTLPQPVRAQVKFIRLPRNPNELYLVGVELEKPANVWGIKGTPEDWVQFSNGSLLASPAETRSVPSNADNGDSTESAVAQEHVASAAERAADAPSAGGNSAEPVHVASAAPVSSEELLRLMEEKIEAAAEKAVASAVTSRVTAAVNQAVKAIENFSQASVRQVEAYCSKYRENMMSSAREELLARLQADLFEAGEVVRKKVDDTSSRAQEAVQQLERTAAQVQGVISETRTLLQGAVRDAQADFAGGLRGSAEKAAAEFTDEAGRIAQRQLARLSEKTHAAGGDAARVLEARAAEARAQLESAAGTALTEFHERAGIEIELALTDSRQNIVAVVESFTAETTANWQMRRQEYQQELGRATDELLEQFRLRLATVVSSSMVAAISAVNEQSATLLGSFAKDANQALRQPGPPVGSSS
jgi:hypothetical protein